MTQLFLPPNTGQRRDRPVDAVNRQFRSLPCAGGCGRSVRCHPAVKLVICAHCTLTQVREKRRK